MKGKYVATLSTYQGSEVLKICVQVGVVAHGSSGHAFLLSPSHTSAMSFFDLSLQLLSLKHFSEGSVQSQSDEWDEARVSNTNTRAKLRRSDSETNSHFGFERSAHFNLNPRTKSTYVTHSIGPQSPVGASHCFLVRAIANKSDWTVAQTFSAL